MPRERTKKCPATKKLCYKTEQEARDQLNIIKMLGPVWRHEQRVYHCRHCLSYHLTSQRVRSITLFDDAINEIKSQEKGE